MKATTLDDFFAYMLCRTFGKHIWMSTEEQRKHNKHLKGYSILYRLNGLYLEYICICMQYQLVKKEELN